MNAQHDGTFVVAKDGMVRVVRSDGEVHVDVVDTDLVVTAEHAFKWDVGVSPTESVNVRLIGRAVRVTGTHAAVIVDSTTGDVTVSSCTGPVEVQTTSGKVWVANCTGSVRVNTMGGPVDVDRCSGDVRVTTMHGPIRLRDVGVETSAVSAYSMYGGIDLERVRAQAYVARSINGGVTFTQCEGTRANV